MNYFLLHSLSPCPLLKSGNYKQLVSGSRSTPTTTTSSGDGGGRGTPSRTDTKGRSVKKSEETGNETELTCLEEESPTLPFIKRFTCIIIIKAFFLNEMKGYLKK